MYDDAAKERQKEAASKAGKASGASRRGETNVPDNCTERSGQDARDQVGQAFGVSGGTGPGRAGSQLTKLQEGQALKRRKEIYEALHPETKKGAQGGGKNGKGTRKRTESDKMSFSEDTAAKTGKSKRTVERAVAAAQNITDEVQQVIDDTPVADNQSQLGKLAALPPEEEKRLKPEAKKNQEGFKGNQHTGPLAKLPKDQKPINTRREAAKTAGVGERTYDAGKPLSTA